ncbi:MAG: PASTA domain-containing protein [Bacteroidota bacterium]
MTLEGSTDQFDSAVTPDFAGLSAREVVFWGRSIGIEVIVEGAGSVVRQSPQAGMPIPESVHVLLR